ncbi:MAG: hypothetical protein Q9211_004629 [Gyalolechia sp. 1 TL-2023]
MATAALLLQIRPSVRYPRVRLSPKRSYVLAPTNPYPHLSLVSSTTSTSSTSRPPPLPPLPPLLHLLHLLHFSRF